ncbi:hypothetical protein C8Q75DRAFT_233067 [Abortiporus biennis]|nr:hypothetical protein C8Q75DRAFT_233067 [Abortiporus biennis]
MKLYTHEDTSHPSYDRASTRGMTKAISSKKQAPCVLPKLGELGSTSYLSSALTVSQILPSDTGDVLTKDFPTSSALCWRIHRVERRSLLLLTVVIKSFDNVRSMNIGVFRYSDHSLSRFTRSHALALTQYCYFSKMFIYSPIVEIFRIPPALPSVFLLAVSRGTFDTTRLASLGGGCLAPS